MLNHLGDADTFMRACSRTSDFGLLKWVLCCIFSGPLGQRCRCKMLHACGMPGDMYVRTQGF